MTPSLKPLLASGRVLRVFGLGQLCSPKLVEIVALRGGFDAVWFDQEHVGLTLPQIEDASRAARAAGIASFVRLAPTDYATVMRPLEAGAGGLMAAMVRSAAQARDLLSWARFHPLGLRGVNGTGVDGDFGSLGMPAYFDRANRDTVVGVQIECAEAVEEVEQIAALPGLDFLFVGPADLSQSLGVPGEWAHPKLVAAVERTARAAEAHHVPWGILPLSAEHARQSVALGCRMLSVGLDSWAFARGVDAFKTEFAEFFPS